MKKLSLAVAALAATAVMSVESSAKAEDIFCDVAQVIGSGSARVYIKCSNVTKTVRYVNSDGTDAVPALADRFMSAGLAAVLSNRRMYFSATCLASSPSECTTQYFEFNR